MTEEVLEEGEIIDTSLEPGQQHHLVVEDRGEKRKPSQDDSGEVKKVGKTEAVAPLSSQSLDLTQFQIVGADSQTLGYTSQDDEVLRAVASILPK